MASKPVESLIEKTPVSTVVPLNSLPLVEMVSISIFVTIGFLLSGCGIYYHDRAHGTDHVWGLGHLAIDVASPNEGKRALVQKITLPGLAVRLGTDSFGISIGWNRRERLFIYDGNTTISFQGPDSFCCGISYGDDSGASHLWAFGHLFMSVTPPSEQEQALAKKTTLTGLAAGLDNGSMGISIGRDQQEHIRIFNTNTAIAIHRAQNNDFFHFKIGTYPPDLESVPPIGNLHNTKEPRQ